MNRDGHLDFAVVGLLHFLIGLSASSFLLQLLLYVHRDRKDYLGPGRPPRLCGGGSSALSDRPFFFFFFSSSSSSFLLLLLLFFFFFKCCFTSTETVIIEGPFEPRTATSTDSRWSSALSDRPVLFFSSFLKCCSTSTETVIIEGPLEPRTATSTDSPSCVGLLHFLIGPFCSSPPLNVALRPQRPCGL